MHHASTTRIRLASLVLGAAVLPACTNFHTVESGRYYRSGQPTAHHLHLWIEKYGIKTVLRLNGGRPGDLDYEASYQPTVEAGIAFIHVPMSAQRYTSKEKLLRLWEIFETAEYPILVHCHAGADRTSLASVIYKLQRGRSYDEAIGQMAFIPYMHLGWGNMDKMDTMFEMFSEHADRMSFPDWVRNVYVNPEAETQLAEPSLTVEPLPR